MLRASTKPVQSLALALAAVTSMSSLPQPETSVQAELLQPRWKADFMDSVQHPASTNTRVWFEKTSMPNLPPDMAHLEKITP